MKEGVDKNLENFTSFVDTYEGINDCTTMPCDLYSASKPWENQSTNACNRHLHSSGRITRSSHENDGDVKNFHVGEVLASFQVLESHFGRGIDGHQRKRIHG